MDEYRFDALGWFQFERLIQGLLKAELGLAVESWGGRGDWGRDAWCQTPLVLACNAEPEPGPFLFQVKFVEKANAAGAKPEPALRDSVNAEIAQRSKGHTRRSQPGCYAFITNAPVTPAIREWIRERIAKVHPNCATLVWSGKDIGDILHRHPSLCRAYPEILSLRNLDLLLAEVVNRDILNRSADALAFARDLAPAFVATEAYFRAFEVLDKHHFVVLDGPPEMGKTTIARMIGLSQVANAWEVFECQEPQDIDRVFQRENHQVFIADDAFGRTEYDPLKGRAWESAIPRLLRRLDGKHWLLWTSRKHILERALSKMDLQPPARTFPNPGEVVVTASELSIKEKALILYRHAKASELGEHERALVKGKAKIIVESHHFTPERIRRLCDEGLKALCAANLDREAIETAIKEAINNPTHSMRKSFLALPEEYRWLLMSRLKQSAFTESALRSVYETYMGPVSSSDFHRRLEDVEGSFLRFLPDTSGRLPEPLLDWVHPSFRDLVIDHLAEDLGTQERYWQQAGIETVAIALSEAGGAGGERRWPLLQHECSWEWFGACCVRLATVGDPSTVDRLIRHISQAWGQEAVTPKEGEHLLVVVESMFNTISTLWVSNAAMFSTKVVWACSELSDMTRVHIDIPDLAPLFGRVEDDLHAAAKDGTLDDPQQLEELLQILGLLLRHNLDWFSQLDNLDRLRKVIQSVETIVSDDLDWMLDTPEDLADHLRDVSSKLSDIQAFLRQHDLPKLANDLIERCDARADKLEASIEEPEEDEPVVPPRVTAETEYFDLWRFFADL